MFDAIVAGLLLVGLSPLMLVIIIVLKLTSRGPVFYKQTRVGRQGHCFKIIKFRSMVLDAERCGPGITSAGDPRVTKIGELLRSTKLDELPQLWNVLRGEMSLVGPRPELPRYVAAYDEEERAVLAVRPGITDYASLAFRWEEELLAARGADMEQAYREVILPEKLSLNRKYISTMSLLTDCQLILRTASALVASRRSRCGLVS